MRNLWVLPVVSLISLSALAAPCLDGLKGTVDGKPIELLQNGDVLKAKINGVETPATVQNNVLMVDLPKSATSPDSLNRRYEIGLTANQSFGIANLHEFSPPNLGAQDEKTYVSSQSSNFGSCSKPAQPQPVQQVQ